MRCSTPRFEVGCPAAHTGVGVIDTGQLIAEHYRLAEHIGSGAMGVVWKAVDVRLERPVAVKQIITQQGLSEQERQNVRQRAMREAKNAARLQHPNAIVVFDIADHAGDPCLVMEYMPGKSLSALLAERGTLPVSEVARIGEQVAGALVAAHRAGIVHRDVKPGNILIDDTGTVKITDFGISRAAGDMTLTQTGLIGGTPAYLAPELARGSDPAPSSDVFALGATLYHAIEGQPVYGESENQLALLYAAASGKVVPPSQAGPATALLMNLLRADPEERPSMSETRQRLAELAGGKGNGTPALSAPPPPQATAPATPPWQRTAAAQNPAAAAAGPPPPPDPTASLDSVGPASQQHPGAVPPPAHTAVAPAAGTSHSPRKSKRKPIIFGSAIAAVLVVAVVLGIVLTSGGEGGQQATKQGGNAAPPPSSQPAPSSTSNSQPSSGAPVEWGPAGQLAIDFYSHPGDEASWQMLTPSVQRGYGMSYDRFEQYWDTVEVQDIGKAVAYKHENNPDGSVDIRVSLTTESGPTNKVVRVVRANGGLRIATDPKLGNSSR